MFYQILRAAIQAQSGIRLRHGFHQLGLQLRVLAQASVDIFRGLIQNLARCDCVAARLAGVRYFEHAGHKLRNAVGAVALPRNPPQLDRLHHSERDQQHCHSGGRRHSEFVALNVFLGPVNEACRPRSDRFVAQIASEIVRQFRRRAIPAGAVSLESFQGDPVQIAAQHVCQLPRVRAPFFRNGRRGRVCDESCARTRRLLFVHLPQNFMKRFALPLLCIQGQHSREQFVEHHAERIDVASGIYIGRNGIHLLRTHVSGRAHQPPGTRHQRPALRLLGDRFGQSEVDNARHRLAIHFNHQNVRGFQVAMNNCFLMRVLHAFTYFCENKQALARRETLLVAVFGDGQALHILHGKVRLAFGRGTGVENLGDGGVIHHGKRLPLQIEAYQCGLVIAGCFDDLQRNLPFDGSGLFRQPHLSHPTFAQFPDQPIGPNRTQAGRRRLRGSRIWA